jgi:hypothetical protein
MADILEKDAKDAGSSPADNGAKDAGPPPAEELIAENKRKAEKIAALEAENKADKARLARLEKLEEEGKLTPKQEREKEELEIDVDSEAKKLRTFKETKPWIKVATEEAAMAELNASIKRANYFIEDKAEEHSTEDKPIKPDEFAKMLKPYAMAYSDEDPDRRNQLAYRDWKKAQAKLSELSDREKKLKEKEDADVKFRERGGRSERDTSLDQKFETASSKNEKLSLLRDMIQTETETK